MHANAANIQTINLNNMVVNENYYNLDDLNHHDNLVQELVQYFDQNLVGNQDPVPIQATPEINDGEDLSETYEDDKKIFLNHLENFDNNHLD